MIDDNFHLWSFVILVIKISKSCKNGDCYHLVFVQDEHTFSTLSFMKTKLRNQLNEHLPLVVDMKCQVFHDLQTFPYDATYNS